MSEPTPGPVQLDNEADWLGQIARSHQALGWLSAEDADRMCAIADTIADRLERPAVEWTDATPLIPGWYWWRSTPEGPPMRVLQTWCGSDGLACYDPWDPLKPCCVSSFSGQWAGPIPEPVTIEPRG